jgi:hypothetical protein
MGRADFDGATEIGQMDGDHELEIGLDKTMQERGPQGPLNREKAEGLSNTLGVELGNFPG